MLLDFKHGGHALTEPAPGSKKSVVPETEIDSMDSVPISRGPDW